MNQSYYEAVDKMEKAGVDPEYIVGWQGGFLHGPKREEQRVNDAYNAGYDDGLKHDPDNFQSWVKKN